MKKEFCVLLILISSGTALRLFNLSGQGLWWDEIFTLLMASGQSREQLGPPRSYLSNPDDIWVLEAAAVRTELASSPPIRPWEVIRNTYQYEPNHPPLYYVAVHFLLAALGVNEFAMRILSVAFDVLTIPCLFWLGWRLASPATGVVAAGLFAVAPVQIMNGQNARMYTLFIFEAVLSMALLIALSLHGSDRAAWKRRLMWAAYGAVTTAGLYTHYLYLIALMIQGLFVALRFRRDGVFLVRWGLSLLVAFGLFLPWMLALMQRTGELPTVLGMYGRGSQFSRVLTALFDGVLGFVWVSEARPYKFFWVWILLFLAGLAALFLRHRDAWLFPLWFGAPLAVVLAADLMRGTDLSSYERYFLLSAPALYLIIGLGVALLQPPVLMWAAALIVFSYLAMGGYWTAKGEIRRHMEFRELGQYISGAASSSDAVVIVSGSTNRVWPTNLAFYSSAPSQINVVRATNRGTANVACVTRVQQPQQLFVVVNYHASGSDIGFDPEGLGRWIPNVEPVEIRSFTGLKAFRYRLSEGRSVSGAPRDEEGSSCLQQTIVREGTE